MRPDDIDEAERLSASAFGITRTAAHRGLWIARTAHVLRTDPNGSWVAGTDDQLAAVAVSVRRDDAWLLSTFAVRDGLRGQGLGRALLDAALAHGEGSPIGMISASSDVGAFRCYRSAGFTMHPQLRLAGRVDRRTLPAGLPAVREGTPADRELLDDLDRRRRGAAHGPDHEILAAHLRLVVLTTPGGAGYAYLNDAGEPRLVCAADEGTATTLLWHVVATAPSADDYAIAHVTAANHWAIDLALAVRLAPETDGYLALRGLEPPTPYLHNGALL
jgi:GNAT superfamily N-acetyltransferase